MAGQSVAASRSGPTRIRHSMTIKEPPKSYFFEPPDGISGSFQELVFRLLFLEPDWRTEGNAAEQRNGQYFAAGQYPVHIVDVDRHKFQVGAFFAEVI